MADPATSERGIRGSALGDALRALHRLQPASADAAVAIVNTLWLMSASRSPGTSAARLPSTYDLPDEPAEPLAHGMMAPRRLVSDAEELPPVLPSTIEELGDGDGAPPDWLRSVPLVPLPAVTPNPFRRRSEPLFDPKWHRAIITRLASVMLPIGEPDMARIVNRIAAGQPLTTFPRFPLATVSKGMQLLIDLGESMEPYRLDVADLARTFARTIGAARVSIQSFRGLPEWGSSAGMETADYRLPPPGVPVTIVSDLGLPPRAPTGLPGPLSDWRAFFARLVRSRHRLVVVVPRDVSELPAALSERFQLVPWGRRTLVSRMARSNAGRGGPLAPVDGPGQTKAPSSRKEDRIEGDAFELACLGSIAVRIEPQLLRALRLALLPSAPVSAEAEFWFSDLVAERAFTGIVISPRHRERLQRELRRDRDRLRRAYAIIEEMHRDAPPALRIEEELAYRSLTGDFESARALLRSLVATLVAPQRGGLSKWAVHALVRLPRELMALEETQMLALGTALRTGATAPLEGLGSAGGRGWQWLRPPIREVAMGINLRRGMIELGPRSMRASHRIPVPDNNPVLMEIVIRDTQDRIERIALNPLARTVIELKATAFEIHVIGGARWLLRTAPEMRKPTKFAARDRSARVKIEYEVEVGGTRKRVQLPFVAGVLGEFSGRHTTPLVPFENRRFVDIDIESFDDRMRAMQPQVAFRVPNVIGDGEVLAIDLTFDSIEAFAPDAVAKRVAALAHVLRERAVLARQREQRRGGTEAIEAAIKELDARLSRQLNLILHHPDFQSLESAWRGLYYLVGNTETDELLKIRILNATKNELQKSIARFAGSSWEQSPLFARIYRDAYEGGEPFGVLIGDYYFDHKPHDVALLGGLAKIAAAAYCPFLAGAAPLVLGMTSWQQLSNPRDLTPILATPEYAAWRALRESEEARFVGLTMPRFLARPPYGSQTVPSQTFNFEEEAGEGEYEKCTWSNSAYAMGANITRAFKLYGWCARIRGTESGGLVEGLPLYTFPTVDGGMDMKCPTEIAITDRREAELAKNGFMPLSHFRNTDYAVFMGAQSLQKPKVYDDQSATSNALVAARLPYLFATCRFMHYLERIARDKVGAFRERAELEAHLNTWIQDYVVANSNASEIVKARKPLAAAQVDLEEIPGLPGNYLIKAFLRPHFQLEGLTVSLRMVARLPSTRRA